MGRVAIRVAARARADEVAGVRGDAVLVRVTAPPVGGKANEAVRKLLAKRLDVPRRSIRIARGASSRDKLVEVDGLESAQLRRRLTAAQE
jgi:uncharacterized protein (TIGR00251 family)